MDLSSSCFSCTSSSISSTAATEVTIQLVSRTELLVRDLTQAASIYQACFEAPPWSEKWSFEDALMYLFKNIKSSKSDVLLAYAGGNVVGLAIGTPLSNYEDKATLVPFIASQAYYISEVAVDSSFQRKGVGTKLISEMVSIGQRTGADTILARTRCDCTSALTLFQKSGFNAIGVISAQTGGKESERTVLALQRNIQ